MTFLILGLILLTCLIIFITYCIIHINNKNNSKISFKESLDLTELPVVTFYNNKKKLNFLLDTGSNISYINKTIINSTTNVMLNKNVDVIGIEGNFVSAEICKMKIEYKNNIFDEEFSIVDMSSAFDHIKKESGVQIHGILGNKFFEKYKYVLDFDKLTAYIK